MEKRRQYGSMEEMRRKAEPEREYGRYEGK
jgi:hypothetical protein